MTYLFYYWKFVVYLNHFAPWPTAPFPGATTNLFYVFMSLGLFLFCLFHFLDFTYKWNHVVFVFDLFYLANIIKVMHVGINGRILFLRG